MVNRNRVLVFWNAFENNYDCVIGNFFLFFLIFFSLLKKCIWIIKKSDFNITFYRIDIGYRNLHIDSFFWPRITENNT